MNFRPASGAVGGWRGREEDSEWPGGGSVMIGQQDAVHPQPGVSFSHQKAGRADSVDEP